MHAQAVDGVVDVQDDTEVSADDYQVGTILLPVLWWLDTSVIYWVGGWVGVG
jgi:hypothetical protein